MPPGRRWHFQVRGREIHLIRAGEEAMSMCGLKYGAIKDITTVKDKKYAGDRNQMILVLFSEGKKGVVSRKNFEWNKNDFCQQFRNTGDATAFIAKWKALTSFDVVTQSTYPTYPNNDGSVGHVSDSSDSESVEIPIASDIPNDSFVDESSPSTSELTSRKRSSVISPCPLPKKSKVSVCPIDESIETKKIGSMKLSVTVLDEPSPSRLLRKIDTVFVENLKKRLQNDPNGPGVPPVAVTCKSVAKKELFKERLKNVYRYEVHGGLHGVKARQSLLDENPSQPEYSTVDAVVYVGLTDEEALRLASRHNFNGHFNHKMTHRDYLEACRARLYAIDGRDPKTDDVPQPSLEWKKACAQYILPQDMPRTQRENIFSQASFERNVWQVAIKVMNAYEKGDLKDQKLNKKQLLSAPEFKQHLLQPIHNLPKSFQVQVLEDVLVKNISLQEMKVSSVTFRSMESIKKVFVRVTSSKNWEEACVRFPDFVKETRLKQFLSLNFKNGVPEVFRNYCDAAIASNNVVAGIVVGGSTTLFVCATFNSVSAHDILNLDPTFTGAHLIMATIPNPCSKEDVESVAYTGRQVNSTSAAVQCFNMTILCDVDQVQMVVTSMQECYDFVEVAYGYNKAKELATSATICLTPSLVGIVIGHWAQDGKLHADRHCSRPHHNVFVYENRNSFIEEMISCFSFDGQTIIDGIEDFGGTVLGRKWIKISPDCSQAEKIVSDDTPAEDSS